MYSKNEFIKQMEKREFFNERKATPETLEFRKLVLENKEELIGTCIQTGDKNWYFMGAGDHKLMFGIFTTGADCTQASLGKNWVVWGKENPLIRKVLLSEIAKIEINGEVETTGDEVETYEEIKRQIIKEKQSRTKTQPAQKISTDFITADKLEGY